MKRILVVEDEQNLSEIYSKLLSAEGFEVSTTDNDVSGLETALREKPDLIILDLLLPQKNGLDMLKDLRKDEWGKDAKVVVMTNLDPDNKILESVVNYKPTFYLRKVDTSTKEMVEKIKEAME